MTQAAQQRIRYAQQLQFPPGTTPEEKIIWAYTRGYSHRMIRKSFSVGAERIARTISYFVHTNQIPAPHTMGRPRVITPQMITHIEKKLLENARMTLFQMKNSIKQTFNIELSMTTIARTYRNLKFQYRPPKHRQLLTSQQKNNRVSFAYSMINKAYEEEIDLSTLVFSDESRFVLGTDKRWIWCRRGEYSPSQFEDDSKFPPSIMVYGAIGIDYKSRLVIVEGSIDSDCYKQNIQASKMIEVLDKQRGRGRWIFQQDGARCHTSRCTIDWLATKCKYISKWPPNSPDLNPIENLWGIMKKAVGQTQPESIQELKDIVLTVWDSLDQEVINNLVNSFFNRLRLVLLLKGESIQTHLRHGVSKQCTAMPLCTVEATLDDDIIAGLEILVRYDDSPISDEEEHQLLNLVTMYGLFFSVLFRQK